MVLLLVAIVHGGCGDDEPPPQDFPCGGSGGRRCDASPVIDAALAAPDAAVPDAPPRDASPPDSSPPDAFISQQLAWWRLEETSGVADDSAGAHDASIVGSVTQGVAGKVGNGIELGGTGHLSAANAPDLQVSTYTVEAWINTSSPNLQWVVAKNPTPDGFNDQISLFVTGACPSGATCTGLPTSGVAAGRIGGCTLGAERTLFSSTRVNDGTWHHLALRLDAAGTVALVVDGVIQAAATGAVPCLNTGSISIGAWSAAPIVPPFLGRIDEVQLWGVARSQAEICSDAGGTPGPVDSCAL